MANGMTCEPKEDPVVPTRSSVAKHWRAAPPSGSTQETVFSFCSGVPRTRKPHPSSFPGVEQLTSMETRAPRELARGTLTGPMTITEEGTDPVGPVAPAEP